MLEEPGEPQVLGGLGCSATGSSWVQLTFREPGWLQATAGPKQIHRTQRYVKVCPSLSFWSCRHAGVFILPTPPALMQRAEEKRRPRGLALQASVGPCEEAEEEGQEEAGCV